METLIRWAEHKKKAALSLPAELSEKRDAEISKAKSEVYQLFTAVTRLFEFQLSSSPSA